MPKTYDEPDAATMRLIDRVLRKYHMRLVEADVTITWRMVHAPKGDDGKPKGPALKHHGVQAAAVIKIANAEKRAAGMDDVLCLLDGDRWPDWSERQRESIVDHELTHLNTTGATEDDGRPKLTMKPHDADCGVFFSTMEKYGKDALDAQIVAKLMTDTRKYIQPMLDWG